MRTRNQLPKSAGRLCYRVRYRQFRLHTKEPAAHIGISLICLLILLFAVFWVLSCGEDSIVNPPAYTYRIPEETGDGWQTNSLEEVGINQETISEAINRINYKLYQNVHGILIVKDGKLVFEEYFSGQDLDITGRELKYVSKTFDRNTLHYQASVTKSVASALFGMAMDKKLINSVDDPLFSYASGGLYLRPRDMAKFGLLYLQGGRWSGGQIISKEWVEQSMQAHIPINSYWDYGYQWWLRTYYGSSRDDESVAARGWGGQYIIVFPGLEMVVVFTGGNYSTPEPVDEILTRFILPAVL